MICQPFNEFFDDKVVSPDTNGGADRNFLRAEPNLLAIRAR